MRNYTTKDGKIIIVGKETENHLLAHADVYSVLEEAVSSLDTNDRGFILEELDLGRVIGKSGAVRLPKANKGEKLLFARRVGRDIYSRVVNATPVDCSSVVVIANKISEDRYNLITAYIGWLSEREPTDRYYKTAPKEELEKSINYWNSYGLIMDPEVFDVSTLIEATWEEILE